MHYPRLLQMPCAYPLLPKMLYYYNMYFPKLLLEKICDTQRENAW